jgi:hypothetical protein
MFNKELKNRVRGLESVVESTGNSIRDRLNKIEKQLKPEPAFKAGDLVNFFLVGNEFEGEIVRPIADIIGWNNYLPVLAELSKWEIKYLDKNEVVQKVVVEEEDIYPLEEDDIDYLHQRINDLVLRLNKLEGRGTKKK